MLKNAKLCSRNELTQKGMNDDVRQALGIKTTLLYTKVLQ